MKRTIKFRGKRTDNGEWITGSYVNYSKASTAEHCILKNGKEMLSIVPETVGQFTNLTDENGKEIYDGDILYFPDKGVKKYVVKFSSKLARFWACDAETKTELAYLGVKLWDEAKVIGNIHDNPEFVNNE